MRKNKTKRSGTPLVFVKYASMALAVVSCSYWDCLKRTMHLYISSLGGGGWGSGGGGCTPGPEEVSGAKKTDVPTPKLGQAKPDWQAAERV